jgi:hypothetical protein
MLFRKEKCFPETKTANLACDRSELVGYGVTGLMTNSANTSGFYIAAFAIIDRTGARGCSPAGAAPEVSAAPRVVERQRSGKVRRVSAQQH